MLIIGYEMVRRLSLVSCFADFVLRVAEFCDRHCAGLSAAYRLDHLRRRCVVLQLMSEVMLIDSLQDIA